MLVSVSCTVQFKQLGICTDECTILYSLAQVHVSNQINDVKLRAIQISGQECQTHHCQHNSINIGVTRRFVRVQVYRGWNKQLC